MTTLIGALLPHASSLRPHADVPPPHPADDTLDAIRLVTRTIASFQPDTMILISPRPVNGESGVWLMGGDRLYGRWAGSDSLPAIQVNNDREFAELAANIARDRELPLSVVSERDKVRWHRPFELDEPVMGPLAFCREAGYAGMALHAALSPLPPLLLYQTGMVLQEVCRRLGRKVAVIACANTARYPSSDSTAESHPDHNRTDMPFMAAEAWDNWLIDTIRHGRWVELLTAGRTDPLGPLAVLLGCFEGEAIHPSFLSHEVADGAGCVVATFLRCDIENEVDSLWEMLLEAEGRRTVPRPIPWDLPSFITTNRDAATDAERPQ